MSKNAMLEIISTRFGISKKEMIRNDRECKKYLSNLRIEPNSSREKRLINLIISTVFFVFDKYGLNPHWLKRSFHLNLVNSMPCTTGRGISMGKSLVSDVGNSYMYVSLSAIRDEPNEEIMKLALHEAFHILQM